MPALKACVTWADLDSEGQSIITCCTSNALAQTDAGVGEAHDSCQDAEPPHAVNVLDLGHDDLQAAKEDDPGVVGQVAGVVDIGVEAV